MILTEMEKVCLMDIILDNLKSGGEGILSYISSYNKDRIVGDVDTTL
jgi:hypothetical protein